MNIGLAYCVTVTGAKHNCFLGQRFPNSVLGERLVFCPSTTQLIQVMNSSFNYLNQLEQKPKPPWGLQDRVWETLI